MSAPQRPRRPRRPRRTLSPLPTATTTFATTTFTAITFAATTFAATTLAAVPISFAAGSVRAPQAAVSTAPEMERIPAGEEWELDFVPKALRVHVDESSGKAYWVLSYEVGNRTDRERTWAPVFELQGVGGPLQRSGRDVPSLVADDVGRLLNGSRDDERPPVLDQNQAIGPLPVGRAHIRDGFAVWPALVDGATAGHDVGPTEVVVYVGGVSNRRGRVDHPVTGEDVILRQQQVIRFLTPGRIGSLVGTPLKPRSQSFIYR